MCHRKAACFEALVLEPHFAELCNRFVLLDWLSSLQAPMLVRMCWPSRGLSYSTRRKAILATVNVSSEK